MRFRRSTALPLLLAIAGAASNAAAQEHIFPLDTVRVSVTSDASAELATPTRAVEVITREQIRRMPARSVLDVLQWSLGVDLMPRSPALADIAIRGSTFEQVLIMVDGHLVSDRQTGHFHLDLAVPIARVERIEVLRGASSALHGSNAVGGVVNIVTGSGSQSEARIEYGSFGTVGLAAAQALSAAGIDAELAVDLERSDGHRPGTDYRIGIGSVSASASVLGRTLNADVGIAARDFGADGFYAPYPSYEETRTTTVTLAWESQGASRFRIDPKVGYRRHGDDFVLRREDPSFYRNQHTTEQFRAALDWRFPVSPRVRLAGGVDGEVDRLRSESLGDRSEVRTGISSELVVGQYGAATGTAGVRADWHEGTGMFLSPGVAGAWWPIERVRVRGSVGRALRTPTWTERYYRDPANVGDPGLASERSWTADLGLEVAPAPNVRLSGSAFVRDAADLIDWARSAEAPVDAPLETRNVADARFRGAELAAVLSDVLGFHVRADGTWLSLRSAAEDGFISKYALRPLVEVLSVSADREIASGLRVHVIAQRAKRRDERSHLRVDARSSVDLGRVEAYLDIRNLNDAVYPDITGAPAPGRALGFGLEWRR